MSASTHNSPSAANHPARPYHKAPLVSKSAPWLSQGPPWSPRQGRPWSLGKVSLGPLGGFFFWSLGRAPLVTKAASCGPQLVKRLAAAREHGRPLRCKRAVSVLRLAMGAFLRRRWQAQRPALEFVSRCWDVSIHLSHQRPRIQGSHTSPL